MSEQEPFISAVLHPDGLLEEVVLWRLRANGRHGLQRDNTFTGHDEHGVVLPFPTLVELKKWLNEPTLTIDGHRRCVFRDCGQRAVRDTGSKHWQNICPDHMAERRERQRLTEKMPTCACGNKHPVGMNECKRCLRIKWGI